MDDDELSEYLFQKKQRELDGIDSDEPEQQPQHKRLFENREAVLQAAKAAHSNEGKQTAQKSAGHHHHGRHHKNKNHVHKHGHRHHTREEMRAMHRAKKQQQSSHGHHHGRHHRREDEADEESRRTESSSNYGAFVSGALETSDSSSSDDEKAAKVHAEKPGGGAQQRPHGFTVYKEGGHGQVQTEEEFQRRLVDTVCGKFAEQIDKGILNRGRAVTLVEKYLRSHGVTDSWLLEDAVERTRGTNRKGDGPSAGDTRTLDAGGGSPSGFPGGLRPHEEHMAKSKKKERYYSIAAFVILCFFAICVGIFIAEPWKNEGQDDGGPTLAPTQQLSDCERVTGAMAIGAQPTQFPTSIQCSDGQNEGHPNPDKPYFCTDAAGSWCTEGVDPSAGCSCGNGRGGLCQEYCAHGYRCVGDNKCEATSNPAKLTDEPCPLKLLVSSSIDVRGFSGGLDAFDDNARERFAEAIGHVAELDVISCNTIHVTAVSARRRRLDDTIDAMEVTFTVDAAHMADIQTMQDWHDHRINGVENLQTKLDTANALNDSNPNSLKSVLASKGIEVTSVDVTDVVVPTPSPTLAPNTQPTQSPTRSPVIPTLEPSESPTKSPSPLPAGEALAEDASNGVFYVILAVAALGAVLYIASSIVASTHHHHVHATSKLRAAAARARRAWAKVDPAIALTVASLQTINLMGEMSVVEKEIKPIYTLAQGVKWLNGNIPAPKAFDTNSVDSRLRDACAGLAGVLAMDPAPRMDASFCGAPAVEQQEADDFFLCDDPYSACCRACEAVKAEKGFAGQMFWLNTILAALALVHGPLAWYSQRRIRAKMAEEDEDAQYEQLEKLVELETAAPPKAAGPGGDGDGDGETDFEKAVAAGRNTADRSPDIWDKLLHTAPRLELYALLLLYQGVCQKTAAVLGHAQYVGTGYVVGAVFVFLLYPVGLLFYVHHVLKNGAGRGAHAHASLEDVVVKEGEPPVLHWVDHPGTAKHERRHHHRTQHGRYYSPSTTHTQQMQRMHADR